MNVIIRLTENEIDRLKYGSEITIPVDIKATPFNINAVVIRKEKN